MVRPSIQEIKQITSEGNYNAVPISMELMADIKTPIEVMRILLNVSEHCYMLESGADNETWGHYSFLGYDPKHALTCDNGIAQLDGKVIGSKQPETYIRELLGQFKTPKIQGFPTFTGGLVGYFSYDYIKYVEPTLRLDAKDSENFKDVDLMLFDKVIAFDHFRQKINLLVNIPLENLEESYEIGIKELNRMAKLIQKGTPKKDLSGKLKGEFTPLFSKEKYCAMVEKGKNHIVEGDIFQIVLSNRLEAEFEGSLFHTYRVLRTINPSPYMFYFSGSDMEVAGASPETLVKLENGTLRTFPLAGTRGRGATEEEDKALEAELLLDEKELAEHNMLVDLGRNDLGRISEFGSVEVESYLDILRYSHVMHIGSTVKGTLKDGKDALDAVNAILPAGTLSGAPKLKACQLINDLEDNKRGIYGGAIGYMDFTGNTDVCIAIRLAYKKNGKVFVRSGAGIVADSVPEKEFEESLNKAAAVVKAIKTAQEVIE